MRTILLGLALILALAAIPVAAAEPPPTDPYPCQPYCGAVLTFADATLHTITDPGQNPCRPTC